MDSRVSWECASVLGFNRWRSIAKVLCLSALVFLLGFSPWWSPSSLAAQKGRSEPKAAKTVGQISETAPPKAIEELRLALEDNQPQVSILSPKPNEVLSEDRVAVQLQVKDLATFKDKKLGLGPHLHVLLDNLQYQAVYDQSQPLVLENLSPGTHTIRAFASRPWHESFKNDGAYAQVTFHVFAKTQENSPDPKLPLLTYSRPQGAYGAEPILLDFYLTNAPLHLVAQENDKDDIADWRIRATVNGESFVIDRWQPLYLKGFKPGKNWVQLEFLDEKGNSVSNTFNNTARLITYDPNGKDTLAKLVRGELTAEQARGIVDPNYVPVEPIAPPAPKPSPTPIAPPAPKPSPTPKSSPTPLPSPTPSPVPVKPTPAARSAPKPEPTPSPSPSPIVTPSPTPDSQPTAPVKEPLTPPTVPEAKPAAPKPEKPGFFNRFRQTFDRGPADEPTIAPPSSPAPAKPSPKPIPRAIPSPITTPSPIAPPDSQPSAVTPIEEPSAPKPAQPDLIDRFRQTFSRKPADKPSIAPAPNPALSSEPTVPGLSPQRSPVPLELQAPEPAEKVLEPEPASENAKAG